MQNKDPEIYFHLGLPKTASTFLQRIVFPQLKGITYLKKRKFNKYKEKEISNSKGKYLFSCEFHDDFEQVIQDIAERYPHAGIILVFRKHSDWLKSKYKYYIRKNGYKPFEEYFDPYHDKGLLKKKNLNYYAFIQLIEKHFSTPPLILFYEELKKNPESTLKMITTWINADLSWSKVKYKPVKTAYNEKQLKFVRAFNRRFTYEPLNSNINILNKLKKKNREMILHSFAFIANFLPVSEKEKQNPLITKETLQKTTELFEHDWEKCLEYAKKTRLKYINEGLYI